MCREISNRPRKFLRRIRFAGRLISLFFLLLFFLEQLLINFSNLFARDLDERKRRGKSIWNRYWEKGSGLNLILSIDSEIEYRYRVLISFCYVPVLFFLFFFFFFHFRLLLHNRSIWQTFLIVFRRCSQLLFRVNTDINNLNFTRNCVYHQHATLPVFFLFFFTFFFSFPSFTFAPLF